MSRQTKKFGLSANLLKIIACISMLIDHIGMFLLPEMPMLRIIGRLAFPIFSFLICEGCRYTKNKLRYFLQIFILGIVTSIVCSFANNMPYFTALITFSCSIILIYLIRYFEKADKIYKKVYIAALFACSLAVMFVFTRLFKVEFGLSGILLPIFPAIVGTVYKKENKLLLTSPKFFAFAVALLAHVIIRGGYQPYALFALIPLALYTGERGIKIPKYSFYIFYPLHMVLLWLLSLII